MLSRKVNLLQKVRAEAHSKAQQAEHAAKAAKAAMASDLLCARCARWGMLSCGGA